VSKQDILFWVGWLLCLVEFIANPVMHGLSLARFIWVICLPVGELIMLRCKVIKV